ncbi:hypothetical protein Tco_1216300 [Tanacetum coccineum]
MSKSSRVLETRKASVVGGGVEVDTRGGGVKIPLALLLNSLAHYLSFDSCSSLLSSSSLPQDSDSLSKRLSCCHIRTPGYTIPSLVTVGVGHFNTEVIFAPVPEPLGCVL